jgi:O-antigen/teichoic acid export membrane protein
MKNNILFYNSISPLIYQVITIICGFILPRLILSHFGTEINGLVNSISQFLGVISFLELGVGAVVQSSLYKPLADNDNINVSKVIASADKFFRKLGYILAIYVGVMLFYYPYLVKQSFGFMFTATLILAISIRSFAQYFFGIVNRLLLVADQKAYIQYVAQTIAIIINTIACYTLITFDCSVQIVYGMTSLIFFLQPYAIHLYIKKYYALDRKIHYDVEPIKQKWNGVAQHVAAVILSGSDTVVLTIFSTLVNVSIYAIYFLPMSGARLVIMSMISGIEALIGNLWAKQDLRELRKVFAWTEWLIHTGTTLIFTLTAVLIVPFVQVYTHGVSDANYIQPLFGILLVAANSGHCLRLPYNIMILAAGHYKQTQHNYIIAAVMNIVISIIGVKQFGLIGVTLGTMAAMVYQTVWMAWYNSKNFIQWPMRNFFKQMAVNAVSAVSIFTVTGYFNMTGVSYLGWVVLAIKATVCGVFVVFLINYIFYKEFVLKITNKIMKRFC